MLLYAVFIVLIGSRDPSLFLLSVSANICDHRRGLAPPTRGSGVGARARLALTAGAMSDLPALRRARLGTAGQAAGPCRGSRLLARRGTHSGAAERPRGRGEGRERSGAAPLQCWAPAHGGAARPRPRALRPARDSRARPRRSRGLHLLIAEPRQRRQRRGSAPSLPGHGAGGGRRRGSGAGRG